MATMILPSNSVAELSSLFSQPGSATSQQFIPVEEAFQVRGEIVGDQAFFHFTVTPGHYLYRDRLEFKPMDTRTTLGEPTYPVGIEKYDYNFEKNLEVYPQNVSISMPIRSDSSLPEVEIRFQGCAEAGLCYPPHSIFLPLVFEQPASEPASPGTPTKTGSQTSGKASQDASISKEMLASLLLFLLGGIGLTFTPCVLPMVPILSSILVGAPGAKSTRIISLTLAYILSMSITFAIAGTLMGLFGASLNLQAKLQSPWLLIPFSALFAALALSLFGLYELQLPQKIRNRLGSGNHQKGSLGGAVLMGVLSALVVSPCVSAPLAGALLYISTTGDAFYGGLSLFTLGLGMGIPLLVIGIGGKQLLPKAGSWMERVKVFFGFLLLAVATWMLERVIPAPLALGLWGMLFTGAALQLGALDLNRKNGWPAAFQTLGLVLLIYGACLIVGAAMGNDNPLKPLSPLAKAEPSPNQASSLQFQKVTSIPELSRMLQAASASGQVVMVDVYADWCISCKVMERSVFPAPQVAPLLSNLTLIKLDITENIQEQQAWLNQYQLFGPPALVFFDSKGLEIAHLRTLGEISATGLAEKLATLRIRQ